jgi:hypothetical protein
MSKTIEVMSHLPKPQFNPKQKVFFVGGNGTIEFCYRDSGTWVYWVEMASAQTGNRSRIGNETTIILYEAELQSDSLFNHLVYS